MSDDTIAEMRNEVAELQAILSDLLDQPTSPATCACGGDHAPEQADDRQRANMATVAGNMSRNYGRERQREDPDEYPAGGRKAWERRQVGLRDTPSKSDEYPSGGRSSWEQRNREAHAEAAQSAAETPLSAGARRSLTARQNAVEPSDWAAAEYPLTAMRETQRRAAKQQRWEQLTEQARRNDPNTTKRRHNSS